MARIPRSFKQNVFINCPFDDIYTPLFNAIVFTIHDIGFRPRCALEASNGGQVRLDKLYNIISECKYSIHDLSRVELDIDSNLPRFNMPLELGIDLGCKRYSSGFQQEKIMLIMDKEPYRFQIFISDIAGQDIYPHGNDLQTIITVVRDWFNKEQTFMIPDGLTIFQRYSGFQKALPTLRAKLHLKNKALPFTDFSRTVST
jgi:hypothetical protein